MRSAFAKAGLALSLGLFFRIATAQQVLTSYPEADGRVTTMVAKGDTLYLGGSFERIYTKDSSSRFGAFINPVTGNVNGTWPKPNGEVTLVIPDGLNGFFLSGTFTQVGDSVRNGLAHLDTNGHVTAWLRSVSVTSVKTMAFRNGALYLGGDFAEVNGTARAKLAAIQVATSALMPWNPGTNGVVNTMVLRDSFAYVGGQFSIAGGVTRNNLAAFSLITGNTTAWNPDANNTVNVLSLAGNIIYAGGSFTLIKSVALNRIAAIELATGNLKVWNGNANAPVRTIYPLGNKVYVGGDFSNIGGQTRLQLACLDSTYGNATTWNPAMNHIVHAIGMVGDKLVAVGQFSTVGTQLRSFVTLIDTASAQPTSFNVKSNGTRITTFAANTKGLYTGGNFTTIGGQARASLAAIQISNGNLLSWNPGSNGTINTMLLSGNDLYVGGSFTNLGGLARNRLALVSGITGTPASWNPGADDEVQAFALNGTDLYVGGYFNTISGQSRGRLAVINALTGNIQQAWNPVVNGGVRTLQLRGNVIYVGGSFSNVAGQTRNNLAAVDLTSGSTTAWNPGTGGGGGVRLLMLNGNEMFVAGGFSTISGNSGNAIAIVDLGFGSAKSGWAPNPTGGGVEALALDGNSLYIGGSFFTSGGLNRTGLAALDATTGSTTSWDPKSNGFVYSLLVAGNKVFAGGDFGVMKGDARAGLAVLSTDTNYFKTGVVSPVACASGPIKVPYTIKDTLNTNNVFTAQLSDASGSFASPVNIGSLPATSSGIIDGTIPAGTAPGSQYRVRVVSNNSAFISSDNGSNITINSFVAPPTGITTSGSTAFCAGDSVVIRTAPGSASYRWLKNSIVLAGMRDSAYTATSSGSYRVVVISSQGCRDTSAATVVTVHPKPATSAITGSASVVVNSTQTYSVANTTGSSYQWMIDRGSQTSGNNGNSIGVLWSSTGQGSVKVQETSASGCKGDTISKVVTIVVPDSLSITQSAFAFAATGGSFTDTLSSDRAWTITNPVTWLTLSPASGNGNAILVLTAAANPGSTRFATVTVAAGTATRSISITQAGVTGMPEMEATNTARLYPNPGSGKFTFGFTSSQEGTLSLTLFSLQGKKVWEGKENVSVGSNNLSLDLGLHGTGVYFLQVEEPFTNTSKMLRMELH